MLLLPVALARDRVALASAADLRQRRDVADRHFDWLADARRRSRVTRPVSSLRRHLVILAFATALLSLFGREANRHLFSAIKTIATILFSLALMAHVVPGFSNLLIVKDAVLSTSAVPYTLYLNFDKAQIGLFLLAFGPPLLSSSDGVDDDAESGAARRPGA